jgi:hypothetical protein
MKTNLTRTIETVEQAEEFLTQLHENGEMIDPNDNPHTIEWSLPKDQQPTPAECDQLRALMVSCLNFDLSEFDAYQFIIDLDEEETRRNKLARPTEY